MPSHWVKAVLAVAMAGAACATPAAAQQDLAITAGQPWTHRHSGISVPPTLGGNALTVAKAYAEDELDVGLSFEPEGAKDFISFYVFRNTNGDVPVWTAQAQWAIENRAAFGKPTLAGAVEAFTPPGQTTLSGLKAIYSAESSGPYTSTGVALLPVGDWYVKVRATSRHRSPEELSRLIDQVLAEIRWPAEIAAAPAAQPVIPCPVPLSFPKKSKDATSGGMSDILGASLMSVAVNDAKKQPTPAVQWCRDKQLGGNIAAYRPAESPDSYLLAYGDNGNGIWAGPSPMNRVFAEIEKTKTAPPRYGVTLHTAAQDILFFAQDRLPSPERTIEIINAGRRASTIGTWGTKREVQINSAVK